MPHKPKYIRKPEIFLINLIRIEYFENPINVEDS